ncbi:T9SS type A sorting domain-containing protein [bacterium]|nr:T9SS type A sorting domain-containing protein [bacterium]
MRNRTTIAIAACGLLVIFAFHLAADDTGPFAFPGAEGSGKYARGGRGGDVYEMTNLSNSGSGSIADAVRSGNRTIVFRVSGTIELGSVILSPKSNTTIAGQTAPGDGICIKGRIQIDASNIIIRYIRVRVDAGAANSSGDAVDISSGKNIIIDHVSASYARDEGISCQEESDSVTVQWCIISEGLTFEGHSYGSLVRGDYGDQKSYHHNLYAHNWSRMPRPGNYTAVTIDPEGLYFDFRNNVVYNWSGNRPGYNDDSDTMSRYNFIGNAYIRGPESSGSMIFRENGVYCIGYFENNSVNGVVPADPWSLVGFRSGYTSAQVAEYKARSALIVMEPVTTTSPEQAQTDVLAFAGASFPKRDIIDTRIVNDVLNTTGHSIATVAEQPEGGWPGLESVPAPEDGDHDGMPDDWELAKNLDPVDPADRNTTGPDGYTMLEWYLGELIPEMTDVDDDAPRAPHEYALLQSYPNPFNPSAVIRFQLPHPGYATLQLVDLRGREVATIADGFRQAGMHELRFDGSGLPSGIYLVRLRTGSFMKTIKICLAR